jgi:hypothetical protein
LVFWDRGDIAPGDDFVDRIADRMANVDVVLAVIGPDWASPANLQRLQDPNDWVRRELESGLRSASTKVAIVRMGDAVWPPPGPLPEELAAMANIQAWPIRSDQFDHDVDYLFDKLELPNRSRRRAVVLGLVALVAAVGVILGPGLLADDPTTTSTPPAVVVATTNGTPSGLSSTTLVESSAATSPPPPTTTTTLPPTFLEQMSGTWTLIDWRERPPDPVTLGMDVLDGTLVVDSIGHAYWDLDLDDGGPPPTFTPGVRCMGIVSSGSEELEGVPGRLIVDGEDLIGTQRDWTSNLQSLRGDVGVAFCGWTLEPPSNLFVFETTSSIYSLEISTAADEEQTPLLTMENVAGTFTWEKQG